MSRVGPDAAASKRWNRRHGLAVVALCVLLLLANLIQWPHPAPRLVQFPAFVAALARYSTVWAWALDALIMAVMTAVITHGLTGSARGIFIDDRNRISLSRLQVVIWTFLILSAYYAASVGNALQGDPDPMGIAIPSTVWAQLGISGVSLVGTSLILSGKKAGSPPDAPVTPMMPAGLEPPAPSWTDRLRAQGVETAGLGVQGSAVVREDFMAARWGDLFRGDDMASYGSLDLSKLQMFFLTTLLTVTYAIAVAATFVKVDRARDQAATPANADAVTQPVVPGVGPATPVVPSNLGSRRVDQFPPLDPSVLALLAIANAGYLASKSVPRPNPTS